MNHVSKSKIEKTPKTSDDETFEGFGNEAMENFEESSQPEETTITETQVSTDSCRSHPIPSIPAKEIPGENESFADSYEARKRFLLREKWLTVTGKKPRNVPTVKKYKLEEEELKNVVFFGDKKPAEVERERKEKWMRILANRKSREPIANFGKVRKEVRLPFLSEGMTCVRFEPNFESITTAYRNGGVQVRNPFTGEGILALKTLEGGDKLPVRGLRYHPTIYPRLYLGGAYGAVQVFDPESGELIGIGGKSQQIFNLDISPDGYLLVTTERNGKLSLYDAYTLDLVSIRERPNIDETTTSSIEDEYHKLRVYGLKFHPTETNLFVTGSWDRTVKVWDIRTPSAITSIRGPFICGDAIDVRDNLILTASWTVSDSVKLWDLSSGQLIQDVPIKTKSTIYQGEFLYTAQFFNDASEGVSTRTDLVAMGGSGFHETIVINVNTGTIVASFPSYKAVLTMDTCRNYVAYGGKESLFRIGEVVWPRKQGKQFV